MIEIISKTEYKKIKKQYKSDENCCFVKLNGKKLVTKDLYFEKLKKKLQLNATFSNNYNAYSDMMRDAFTYYNKEKIVFLIKHYNEFLSGDQSKKMIEKIFNDDIIPFFENEISEVVQKDKKKEIHVYCVKSE